MEKINFVNNQTPYIDADILNLIQNNIENAINEIVESGENENGSWIKWADGTMICTCTRYFENIACSTQWGTLYESGSIDLGSFPQTFINIPVISVISHNVVGSTSKACFVEWVSNTTTDTIGTTIVARPLTGTINVLSLSIIAIGKWK